MRSPHWFNLFRRLETKKERKRHPNSDWKDYESKSTGLWNMSAHVHRRKPGETPGTIVLPASPLFQGTLLLTTTTLQVLDPRWVEELLPETQVGLWLPTTALQTTAPTQQVDPSALCSNPWQLPKLNWIPTRWYMLPWRELSCHTWHRTACFCRALWQEIGFSTSQNCHCCCCLSK